MNAWARIPLDFDPGTKWQYSNTNYVIAGSIVEKVSGMKLMQFLQQRIFTPLKMTSVVDFDAGPLGPDDAAPLLRNAVGPFRRAPKEAAGWLLAPTTLHDGSRSVVVNISIINRSLLKPARTWRCRRTLCSHLAPRRDTASVCKHGLSAADAA